MKVGCGRQCSGLGLVTEEESGLKCSWEIGRGRTTEGPGAHVCDAQPFSSL